MYESVGDKFPKMGIARVKYRKTSINENVKKELFVIYFSSIITLLVSNQNNYQCREISLGKIISLLFLST